MQIVSNLSANNKDCIYLPDVKSGLSHDELRVGASHVQAGKHAVATRFTERTQDHGLRRLCAEVVILVRALRRPLSTHSRHAVQEVTQELH